MGFLCSLYAHDEEYRMEIAGLYARNVIYVFVYGINR